MEDADEVTKFIRRNKRFFALSAAVPIAAHAAVALHLANGQWLSALLAPSKAAAYIVRADHTLLGALPSLPWHWLQLAATAAVAALAGAALFKTRRLPQQISNALEVRTVKTNLRTQSSYCFLLPCSG